MDDVSPTKIPSKNTARYEMCNYAHYRYIIKLYILAMKTTYFKTIVQKSTATHSILVAVIPNGMLGDLPNICEIEAFMMPQTIYTGTYPNIRINTDTVKDRVDLKGMGIAGIITEDYWFDKVVEGNDILGIGI